MREKNADFYIKFISIDFKTYFVEKETEIRNHH